MHLQTTNEWALVAKHARKRAGKGARAAQQAGSFWLAVDFAAQRGLQTGARVGGGQRRCGATQRGGGGYGRVERYG